MKLIFKLAGWLIVAFVFSSCGNKDLKKEKQVAGDTAYPEILALNKKIEADRNNSELYYQRAKARFFHRDFQNAIADMQIVLKIDSTKSAYYIFLSDLYLTQNKSKDTRQMLRKAIAVDSSNSEALMKYSELFYLMRKYDTAIFYVNRSLHFDRNNPLAHFQRGLILKEWGDTAKAIASFQLAVELNQKYFEAYMQLGIINTAIKNPLALEYFNTALSLDPKSVEARYAKGFYLQSAGELPKALEEYKAILDIYPDHKDARYNTGAILHEQKKYAEAIQQFETIL
ncbi:MAG TPA: tetratricopeptide repeat protein, partial [Bacteroidia bacterium]